MGERRGTKALELWCRRMTEGYPGVRIENMTTSWRNGLAFCALVHRFRSDLIDFDKLDANDVYYNNELAFRAAEAKLGIPALLDATDMASYEVPDRLSILTYLSQYYQKFAAQQESANRLKRTSIATATDKTSPNSSNGGPPQKMQHVLKREPCHKCQLPVFLAERLVHGTRLYHRTCMRCARCKSQLTPGNFYETESDGEFCCETCPDEDAIKDDIDTSESRQSFSNNLALFQMRAAAAAVEESGKGLLAKSLSDEEKTKSLKRLTAIYSMHSADDALGMDYTSGLDMGKFMSTQLETGPTKSGEHEIEESGDEDEDDEDDDYEEEEEDEPPSLPTAKPPTISESKAEICISFLAPEQEPVIAINEKPAVFTKPKEITINRFSSPTMNTSNIQNYNISSTNRYKPHTDPLISNEPSSISLDIEDALTNKGTLDVTEKTIVNVPDDTKKTESEKVDSNEVTVRRLSTVRARLQQFEKPDEDLLSNKININRLSASSNKPLFEGPENQNKSNDLINHDTVIVDIPLQSEEESSSNKVISYRLSTTISKKLFDDPSIQKQLSFDSIIHDPVVPVAETLEIISLVEPAQHTSDLPNDLDHFKEIALRQAIEEINDKVHEHELEQEHVEELEPELADEIEQALKHQMEPAKTPKHEQTHLVELENKLEINAVIQVVYPTPRKRSPKTKSENVETKFAVLPKPEVKMRSTPHFSIEPENCQLKEELQQNKSYPEEFNPFGEDEDEASQVNYPEGGHSFGHNPSKRNSFNPFDSSDDEVELDKNIFLRKTIISVPETSTRQSMNPFGSDTEEEKYQPVLTTDSKRTPVPTPRKITPNQSSLNSTPEPTPRPSRSVDLATPQSLNSSIGYFDHDSPLSRNQHYYGSTSSLASTASALNLYTRRNKSRAPLPPSANKLGVVAASQPNTLKPSPSSSARTSPSASVRNTPTSSRKKRPAPAPPSAVSKLFDVKDEQQSDQPRLPTILSTEDSFQQPTSRPTSPPADYLEATVTAPNQVRKLIPLDDSLIESPIAHSIEHRTSSPLLQTEVVYRRTIMPLDISNLPGKTVHLNDTHDRQWQKVKENKESLNKNRQSQCSVSPDRPDLTSPAAADNETSLYSNKSTHGKWKRRKGPAPSLPVIMGSSTGQQRSALQMLPLQDIRYELEVIEVQQQGLEKQGIQLEKMIRERCEGGDIVKPIEELANTPNTKEVEDLILQLFEIVNEKNELFRRQAELMYIRRLHRLEQEQAQIDFDIRMLMAQPESNKTDSDKAHEDALIARKVEIVLQRNEVIDCLDADRLREAEEDQSIKLRLELHNARRDEEPATPIKLSKKEKKKIRETKKLAKQKKMDADKDADESEVKAMTDAASKKKKRKFLF